MTNLVISNMQAPSFAVQAMNADQIKAMNAAAAVGTGGGSAPNRIGIKAGRFRLIIGGQETAVLPVTSIRVAVVRVNDGINKVFFEKAWNPNDEPTQPDCSSDDGITPRADSPKLQNRDCATCPQNQWGSKINPTSGAKTKACQDSKRMAILAPNNAGVFDGQSDLFQLAVPPASLGDFGGMVRSLSQMPTPASYNMVEVEVSFDPAVSFPKLLFKPSRWLTGDEYTVVSSLYDEQDTKWVAGLPEAQPNAVGTATAAQSIPGQQPVQQPAQQQPQQNVQQQPQQNMQQPATGGWGDAQPANQQQVQQPAQQAAAGGWGEPQQVNQQPQQNMQQPAQQAAAGGWGEPQQNVQQNAQQPQFDPSNPHGGGQQNTQQPAQQAPQRVRGQPSPGKKRRTPAEMEEDRLADERDNQGGQQSQPANQQQVQQPAQQAAAGGWGEPQQVNQQPQQNMQQPAQQAAAGGWGEPQQNVQQPQQNVQQSGAPVQPNVMAGNVAADAFAGWDD